MAMDPSEVEFIAEKQSIMITPSFTLDKLYLIGGDVGPFTPAMPLEVPLWLAINLKQRQKCHIIPPPWMNVDILEEKKREEIDSALFTEAPNPHYMELTQLLLKYASDDIPRADDIRTLVKDLWDVRLSKLRSSVDSFVKSENTHAKLNYLTLMEINTIRPFLTKALDQLFMLRMNLTPQGSSQYSSLG